MGYVNRKINNIIRKTTLAIKKTTDVGDDVHQSHTFQASSPKPLGRLEPNLAGMFLGWSSTKLMFFVPVGYSIWLPRPIHLIIEEL
jgi:hypothetical protein